MNISDPCSDASIFHISTEGMVGVVPTSQGLGNAIRSSGVNNVRPRLCSHGIVGIPRGVRRPLVTPI